MKLNPSQEKHLAYRLAQAVVAHYLKEVQEAGGDAEGAKGELEYNLLRLETAQPFLHLRDFQDRDSLEAKLVGLESFLNLVQRRPEAAVRVDDLPEGPGKWESARALWQAERLQ